MEGMIEMGCNLYIDTSDEHPSLISERTNLLASEIIVKGEPFKTPTGNLISHKLNKQNLWVFKMDKIVGKEEDVFLEAAIEKFLDIMDERKNILMELLEIFPKNHLKCFYYCNGSINPYFHLNQGLLKRLAEYNLSVEFDLYT